MEKLDNKKLLKIISLCILIGVPFIKFFSMNLEMFGVVNNYDYTNPAIILYISVPILLFVYINNLIKTKRKLDIIDYVFFFLVITGIISTVFSIDYKIAIFGKNYRHEGLLSILSYYLLFINWRYHGTKDDIKSFIKFLVIIAVINSIYALFQIYTDFDFILRYSDDKYMAMGLCGNPNFFGSFIVTILSIIVCNFLIDEKVNLKESLIIILLFISLINAQSTGPFITLFITIIFIAIFLRIKKKLNVKKLLILSSILILTYPSVSLINSQLNLKNNEFSVDGITETVESGGNGRLKIWENSLDIVKNNFVNGVGFDNFYLAYPNKLVNASVGIIITNGKFASMPNNYCMLVDNAHNVYLHTLTTTGILGLIPYLLLCLITFIKGLKSNNKLMFLLLSGFVAYSIQAFANISVIQVAPIYYLIIGLMLSIKD